MRAVVEATTRFEGLEQGLKALITPYIGDLRYKEIVDATRYAFLTIVDDLRDRGMTWAQVTELTGAPRTTINSLPPLPIRAFAFKNRFMSELRQRPGMRLGEGEAAMLYYRICEEEDRICEAEDTQPRRAGFETFLRALESMRLIVRHDDRRRTIEATSGSDSTICERPATGVLESIRAYGSRIVDAVLARSPRRTARVYRTQFRIAPEDIGGFLEAWKDQTLELIRDYEARARERDDAEHVAVVYGGATLQEIQHGETP